MPGVQGVVVEIQPFLCPCADDPAVSVVVDGVFLVFATHRTVAVVSLPETALGAPPAKYGVPACEADPWREVFHDALEVVHASACVNARPPF